MSYGTPGSAPRGAKTPSARDMQPPKMPRPKAVWLIEHWGSARYRNDLLGDLIEQYRGGRSRAWCWRQAVFAIWLARVEAFRRSPWMSAVQALILAFGLITLGASTLSWAESVHEDACRAANCGAVAATMAAAPSR